MPNLCSTSLLQPITNVFGSGFTSAGKICLLIQQQQTFCKGSTGLLCSAPGDNISSPGALQGWRRASPSPGLLTGLDALPRCLPPPPQHGWGPLLLQFGLPGTDTPCSWLLGTRWRRRAGNFGKPHELSSTGWWQLSSAQHSAGVVWCGQGAQQSHTSLHPSPHSLTCRWDHA